MSYVCCRIAFVIKFIDLITVIVFAMMPFTLEFDKPESPKYPIILYFSLFLLGLYDFICVILFMEAGECFRKAYEEMEL